MESKEEAAVERQKLVPDDTENEPDDDQLPPPPNIVIGASSVSCSASSALPNKQTQAPISPVLSHKIFSSGETSRTQDSSNCSVGRGGGNSESCGGGTGSGVGGPHSATRLMYVNERSRQDAKQQQQADYKAKARRIQRDDGDPPGSPPRTPPPMHSSHTLPKTHTNATNITSPHPSNNTITVTPLLHSIPASENRSQQPPTPPTIQPSSSCSATTAVPPTMGHTKHDMLVAGAPAPIAPAVADVSLMFEQRSLKHHSFVSEVPDVRHMERALLGLLEDFHLGKLKAFGSGCTMDQMTDIREQQESLAKLHFELGAGGDPLNGTANAGANSGLNAQENMTQLVAKLENLSVSIERLHSSNSNL